MKALKWDGPIIKPALDDNEQRNGITPKEFESAMNDIMIQGTPLNFSSL